MYLDSLRTKKVQYHNFKEELDEMIFIANQYDLDKELIDNFNKALEICNLRMNDKSK